MRLELGSWKSFLKAPNTHTCTENFDSAARLYAFTERLLCAPRGWPWGARSPPSGRGGPQIAGPRERSHARSLDRAPSLPGTPRPFS